MESIYEDGRISFNTVFYNMFYYTFHLFYTARHPVELESRVHSMTKTFLNQCRLLSKISVISGLKSPEIFISATALTVHLLGIDLME